MKSTHEVSTKVDKDTDAKTTVLTVNWPDGQNPTVQSMAAGWLIVKLQTGWRKNGIPAKLEVDALEHAPGSRTMAKPTVEGLAAKANVMSKEEREKLVKQLQLMDSIR